MGDDTKRKARWPLVVVGLVIGAALAVWVWEDLLEDRFIPKRWGTVVDGRLYRSGQLHPALVERTLRDHEVDLVVSLIDLSRADAEDVAFDEAEREACAALQIERQVHPLQGDGTGDPASYVSALAAIAGAVDDGKTVLVHCAAGSQRTGGVVALWRVLREGWTPEQARLEMARYDWDPVDDHALVDYLDTHMPQLVEQLADRGVIRAIPAPLPKFHE